MTEPFDFSKLRRPGHRVARVIDYETTGKTDNDAAEVIEMGRIDVDVGQRRVDLESMWHSFACPRGPIPPETKAVHHITEADVRGAPQARELWDTLFEGLVSGDYLVAHQADFEKHFHDGDGLTWIDTYKVARIVWPDAPGHSNQCLRYWLELDLDPRLAFPPHRALPDAYVTAHLFCRLLEHKTPEEMATISRYPALLKMMNFGKYYGKGMTFERCAQVDESYLGWLRNDSSMGEDVKFSAHYWLRKLTTIPEPAR